MQIVSRHSQSHINTLFIAYSVSMSPPTGNCNQYCGIITGQHESFKLYHADYFVIVIRVLTLRSDLRAGVLLHTQSDCDKTAAIDVLNH